MEKRELLLRYLEIFTENRWMMAATVRNASCWLEIEPAAFKPLLNLIDSRNTPCCAARSYKSLVPDGGRYIQLLSSNRMPK
jgi:hypothetical protein